jgi:hypothetical protein
MCHVHTDGEQHGDHEDARAFATSAAVDFFSKLWFIGLRMVY